MSTRPEFSAEQILRAVADVTGLDTRADARWIPRGFANENWKVETADGPVLCKIGPVDAVIPKWRGAVRALELARGSGVPAPRLLAFVECCQTLGGRLVRVFEYVEGLHPTALADLSRAHPLWAELGCRIEIVIGPT